MFNLTSHGFRRPSMRRRVMAHMHRVSTSTLRQLCHDTSNSVLIEKNGVTPECGGNPFSINYTVFNENIIASVIVALTLTLSVNQASAATLRQLCNDAINSVLIEINGDVWKWVTTGFWSIITELTLCVSIAEVLHFILSDVAGTIADASLTLSVNTLKLARPSLTGGGCPLESEMMHCPSTDREGRNFLLISQFVSLFRVTRRHEGQNDRTVA